MIAMRPLAILALLYASTSAMVIPLTIKVETWMRGEPCGSGTFMGSSSDTPLELHEGACLAPIHEFKSYSFVTPQYVTHTHPLQG